uniref:SEA domain-containing protein n=1 Tax=Sphenodon punctatus TaxID=8508 RepID=A0A8D0H5H4_SPHPU
ITRVLFLFCQLNKIFKKSSFQNSFVGCSVDNLRRIPLQSHTGIDSTCQFKFYSRSSGFDTEDVYKEFERLTNGATELGNFTLDRSSLRVDGFSPKETPIVPRKPDLPFWAIILICLSVLLGMILLFLLCFLIAACLRRKSDMYQVRQGLHGVYFPHLGMQKMH